MTLFPIGKEEFVLEGQMPERALLRLRRAHISLFCIKKIEKNQILFRVNRKDSEKVFAIFRSVCYNSSVCSAYTIKSHGVVGVGKYVEWLKELSMDAEINGEYLEDFSTLTMVKFKKIDDEIFEISYLP